MSSLPAADYPITTRDDIRHLEQQVAELKAAIDHITHDLHVQFTRIAQLQADNDLIRAAWSKVTAPADRPLLQASQHQGGAERRRMPRNSR
jgi:hypothetical protein